MDEAIDFLVIEAWFDELEDSRRRRLLKSRPNIDNATLKRMSDVEEIEDSKYRLISIGGTIDFAVEKKTGLIYPVVKDEIKRKTNYGRLMDWDGMDWEPYYPYKKSLYAWQDEAGEETGKKVPIVRTASQAVKATVETKQGSEKRTRKNSQRVGNDS